MNLPHTDGEMNGNKVVLDPFLKWILGITGTLIASSTIALVTFSYSVKSDIRIILQDIRYIRNDNINDRVLYNKRQDQQLLINKEFEKRLSDLEKFQVKVQEQLNR